MGLTGSHWRIPWHLLDMSFWELNTPGIFSSEAGTGTQLAPMSHRIPTWLTNEAPFLVFSFSFFIAAVSIV